MTFTIDIRPRRQTTIPQELLDQVGVAIGDTFLASFENDKIVLVPRKKQALDAFKTLQKIIQSSGVSEGEVQKNAVDIRKRIYEKRFSARLS